MLTQENTTVTHGKEVYYHPITYVSGLFQGSPLNWAALTKEAYAIYMQVKMLSSNMEYASIIPKSEHLPLKRFLQKTTLYV